MFHKCWGECRKLKVTGHRSTRGSADLHCYSPQLMVWDDGATALCGVLVYAPAFAGTCCAYPWRDCQAVLIRVAGYIPRWLARPKMVTHSNINWAQHRVTSLIETDMLPPSQTAISKCIQTKQILTINNFTDRHTLKSSEQQKVANYIL